MPPVPPLTEMQKHYFEDLFYEINLNSDTTISRDELFFYLDRICDGKFDRNIAATFYDKIPKDHYNKITLNEFYTLYYQFLAETDKDIEDSNLKLAEIGQYITDNEEDKKFAQKTFYDKDPTTGKLVPKKILRIVLHEVDNVEFDSALISLYVNSTMREPKVVHVKGGKTPLINREYDIVVKDSMNDNALFIKLEDALNKGTMSFENKIMLSSLMTQKKFIHWVDLFGIANKKTTSRIRMTCQYVHDSDVLFNDVSNMWKKEQEGIANKIDKLIYNRNQVYPPTEVNVRNFIKTIAQHPIFIKPTTPSDDIALINEQRQKSLFNITSLKSPYNSTMSQTNYCCYAAILVAMFALEYRYIIHTNSLDTRCRTLCLHV